MPIRDPLFSNSAQHIHSKEQPLWFTIVSANERLGIRVARPEDPFPQSFTPLTRVTSWLTMAKTGLDSNLI